MHSCVYQCFTHKNIEVETKKIQLFVQVKKSGDRREIGNIAIQKLIRALLLLILAKKNGNIDAPFYYWLKFTIVIRTLSPICSINYSPIKSYI